MPSSDPAAILVQLEHTIAARRALPPGSKSYVRSLLDGGISAVAAKVSEESAEVVEAAAEPGEDGRAHLVREAADLAFHLLVLLAARDVAWAQVEQELARRFGISGIDEKAARRSGD
jgi:phosphoribosyl-ATP pyrophosphohydrolase